MLRHTSNTNEIVGRIESSEARSFVVDAELRKQAMISVLDYSRYLNKVSIREFLPIVSLERTVDSCVHSRVTSRIRARYTWPENRYFIKGPTRPVNGRDVKLTQDCDKSFAKNVEQQRACSLNCKQLPSSACPKFPEKKKLKDERTIYFPSNLISHRYNEL